VPGQGFQPQRTSSPEIVTPMPRLVGLDRPADGGGRGLETDEALG
jgi:hypothetical protein